MTTHIHHYPGSMRLRFGFYGEAAKVYRRLLNPDQKVKLKAYIWEQIFDVVDVTKVDAGGSRQFPTKKDNHLIQTDIDKLLEDYIKGLARKDRAVVLEPGCEDCDCKSEEYNCKNGKIQCCDHPESLRIRMVGERKWMDPWVIPPKQGFDNKLVAMVSVTLRYDSPISWDPYLAKDLIIPGPGPGRAAKKKARGTKKQKQKQQQQKQKKQATARR